MNPERSKHSLHIHKNAFVSKILALGSSKELPKVIKTSRVGWQRKGHGDNPLVWGVTPPALGAIAGLRHSPAPSALGALCCWWPLMAVKMENPVGLTSHHGVTSWEVWGQGRNVVFFFPS